jgi:hypothetical protein
MSAGRAEPFGLALQALRERLRVGDFVPGERIRAVALAEELRLSATPVREALARLAGEGLVEDRRGEGYFVGALSGVEIADLYRLQLAHLRVALDPHRPAPGQRRAPTPMALDPVAAVEQLFLGWVLQTGGRALGSSYRTIMVRLGPARRKEPLLFGDLAEEAARLATLASGAGAPAGRRQLVSFHRRRVAAAERIARLLETRSQVGEVWPARE